MNILHQFRAAGKFGSSFPVRLDETLPKLVEFTKSRQISQTRDTKLLPAAPPRMCFRLTARSAIRRPGACNGRTNRTPSTEEPFTMAAKKKTARKSTKKKATKRAGARKTKR